MSCHVTVSCEKCSVYIWNISYSPGRVGQRTTPSCIKITYHGLLLTEPLEKMLHEVLQQKKICHWRKQIWKCRGLIWIIILVLFLVFCHYKCSMWFPTSEFRWNICSIGVFCCTTFDGVRANQIILPELCHTLNCLAIDMCLLSEFKNCRRNTDIL